MVDFGAAIEPTEEMEAPPPVYPVMDVEKAKKELSVYVGGIDKMYFRINELNVDSRELNDEATTLGAGAAKLLKTIDEARKRIIKQPSDFVDSVNAFCKMFTERLKQVKELSARKTAQWALFVEQERQKAEMEARRIAEETRKKLEAEAEALNKKAQEEAKAKGIDPATIQPITPPITVDPIIPKKETVTRTEAGSASVTQRWTFKIVDASKVPREYLVVSETLVRNAVNRGERNIQGVEIYLESKSRFRT